MANTLAELNNHLAIALRDTTYATWAATEMDSLLTWSLARLYPRFARQLQPQSVTLVANTYYYTLPAGVLDVYRVDYLDTGGTDYGTIGDRAWELVGDPLGGTGQIHVAPQIVAKLGTLKLHGYGRYDGSVTANLIPDDYVQLVLAKARAEALRRVLADRERFKAWLVRNQSQNISVNEMIQMVNEADREARVLESQLQVWHRPRPGRQGS